MKINEFFDKQIDTSLPFDVVDDVAIFMRNDPIFYRKSFFPAVMKMKGMYDKGKAIDAHECLGECVSSAIESYCRKFNINKRPDQLMSEEEKDELVKKLYAEEFKQIKDGAY
jgi:hypothetical protein